MADFILILLGCYEQTSRDIGRAADRDRSRRGTSRKPSSPRLKLVALRICCGAARKSVENHHRFGGTRFAVAKKLIIQYSNAEEINFSLGLTD